MRHIGKSVTNGASIIAAVTGRCTSKQVVLIAGRSGVSVKVLHSAAVTKIRIVCQRRNFGYSSTYAAAVGADPYFHRCGHLPS